MRALPVKVSLSYSVCQGEQAYCLVRCHTFFLTFPVVIKDENENRKTRYLWSADGDMVFKSWKFSPDWNLHADCWSVGEGALNEGSVRKWCRLFKEGRDNFQWRGTKRKLEKLKWVILECRKQNFDFAPSEYHLFILRKTLLADRNLRSDQETKDVLQNWRIKPILQFLALKENRAGTTIWQVS